MAPAFVPAAGAAGAAVANRRPAAAAPSQWTRRHWRHPTPASPRRRVRVPHQRLRLTATAGAPAATPPPPTALLLVDHGSRVAGANAALDDLAALVASRDPLGRPVYAAHMELAAPSIADGLAAAAAAGAARVVVVPVFLSEGRHARQDIPALVAAAVDGLRSRGVGVDVDVAGVLGVHAKVADLLLERAGEVAGA